MSPRRGSSACEAATRRATLTAPRISTARSATSVGSILVCTAIEPISVRPRGSGDPDLKRSHAWLWVPASAGTNGINGRFKFGSSRSRCEPRSASAPRLGDQIGLLVKQRHAELQKHGIEIALALADD